MHTYTFTCIYADGISPFKKQLNEKNDVTKCIKKKIHKVFFLLRIFFTIFFLIDSSHTILVDILISVFFFSRLFLSTGSAFFFYKIATVYI